MKKLILLLTLLALLGTTFAAFAEEVPWKFSQRPPKLMYVKDGVYALDDVRWGFDEQKDAQGRLQPKWRKAYVDTRAVTKAYLCVKVFPPEWIAGHGLMLYRFEPDAPVKTSYKETSKGFFISVEARLKENQKFSITQGLKRKWPTVWQFCSFEDYLQQCAISNLKMILYELDLSREEVQKMLVYSLDRGLKEQGQTMYHTLDESCITAQVDMINLVVDKKRRIRQSIFGIPNPLASLPRTIGLELRRKHLLKRTLPVFQPKEERIADHTTKQLSGDERRQAMTRLQQVYSRSQNVERQLLEAVENGLYGEKLRELLYNEVSDYAPHLFVPGVVPGEAKNGELVLGPAFGTALREATDAQGLQKVLRTGFAHYRQGLKTRMLLEGPDISTFVLRRLTELERGVREALAAQRLMH